MQPGGSEAGAAPGPRSGPHEAPGKEASGARKRAGHGRERGTDASKARTRIRREAVRARKQGEDENRGRQDERDPERAEFDRKSKSVARTPRTRPRILGRWIRSRAALPGGGAPRMARHRAAKRSPHRQVVKAPADPFNRTSVGEAPRGLHTGTGGGVLSHRLDPCARARRRRTAPPSGIPARRAGARSSRSDCR